MNKESFKQELVNLGLEVSNEKVDLLENFMLETLKANESINLTAIKDKDKFWELMILDSAYPLKYLDYKGKKVIDIGTGAGYPGMVMATLSDAEFTLLDATKKKVNFFSNYADEHKYPNIKPVCARAEEFAREHREEYDIAVARAVADLPILLELTIPLLKVDGYFIALKGSKGLEELEKSRIALDKLGAVVEQVDEYQLPESKEKRINIVIKMIKKTSPKYPRDYSVIINNTLK